MNSDLNETLKHFEAAEANLVKLERLWAEMTRLLASASSHCHVADDEAQYEARARSFRRLLTAMPKIDGYVLEDVTQSYTDVFRDHLDANEVGELEALLAHHERVAAQGHLLADYRFRLDAKRRELTRLSFAKLRRGVEESLEQLSVLGRGLEGNEPLGADAWGPLQASIKSIDALLGSSVQRPDEWATLARHLRFGLKCDLDDIVERDWPSVKAHLERALYGEDDPLPVAVDDLGELVKAKPSGPIVTDLQWGQLSDADFERLLFNLVSGTPGYERPEWPTHTNAPDRGRDLSVYRVHEDALAGPRRSRVIVACKHWQSKPVRVAEVTLLKEQVSLWEPPRVDVLVVATSGRFSTDAVQWVEKHNQSNAALHIEMWPNSHLELLLARRPDLIAQFKLR